MNYNGGLVIINCTWEKLFNIISVKSVLLQYDEQDQFYELFVIDDVIVYVHIVFKAGYEPSAFTEEQIAENTANRESFIADYESVANQPLSAQTSLVCNKPIDIGTKAWIFTPNLCDKTTWFAESVRITNEAVGTGDGSTTVFNLAHANVIDLTHGKISDEDFITGTYSLIVKVDGVEKTQKIFNNTYDFELNYATGRITFVTAPANLKAIVATYSYSPTDAGSTIYITPPTNKTFVLNQAECQFAANLELTTNLNIAIFTYNPGLGAPPNKYEYPGSRTIFKTFADFVNYSRGSFPIIPSIGGSSRGSAQNIIQLRFDYLSPIVLDSAYGAEIRIWLDNDIPYTGEKACVTFYGVIETN